MPRPGSPLSVAGTDRSVPAATTASAGGAAQHDAAATAATAASAATLAAADDCRDGVPHLVVKPLLALCGQGQLVVRCTFDVDELPSEAEEQALYVS